MLEGIVLAGGFGTRLQQVVPDLPKPMAPIGNRPFLEILLTLLVSKGIQRIVLSLGYRADKIIDYFGDQFAGAQLIYEIEESPLGTGGALRLAMSRCSTDHVFIFNGDTFLDLEIAELEGHWQQNHTPIIVASEVPDTSRYGRLNASNGRVLGFHEKGQPGKGLINAGCYVFPTDILDNFTIGQKFSLETDFLAGAVARHRFDVFQSGGRFIDIGIPEDYARARSELMNESS